MIINKASPLSWRNSYMLCCCFEDACKMVGKHSLDSLVSSEYFTETMPLNVVCFEKHALPSMSSTLAFILSCALCWFSGQRKDVLPKWVEGRSWSFNFFFQYTNVVKSLIKKLWFTILSQLPNRNMLGYFSALQENLAAMSVQLDEYSSWHGEAFEKT